MAAHVSTGNRQRLIAAAREAAQSAYAPYSRFRVGAAVLGEQGIHIGTNVENASYGLALCAERAALAAAVSHGDRHITAVALACIDASGEQDLTELLPCGACRQWMSELCRDAQIIICGAESVHIFSVEELLPMPFQLANVAPAID
jgi:cytidine deaminase